MRTLGEMGSAKKQDVSQYGEDSYWEKRYADKTTTFEWFVSLEDAMGQYPMLRGILESRVQMKAKVLEIGCGTSGLCEALWDLGFREIDAIDNQPKAIEFCQSRQGPSRHIRFHVADMMQLKEFKDASVDLVVDKGALDALVCRGGTDLAKCGAELWRLLRPKETSLLLVLSNAPLTEVVDGLKPWFQKEQMFMVKNTELGQLMAKCYLFSRRKSPSK